MWFLCNTKYGEFHWSAFKLHWPIIALAEVKALPLDRSLFGMIHIYNVYFDLGTPNEYVMSKKCA